MNNVIFFRNAGHTNFTHLNFSKYFFFIIRKHEHLFNGLLKVWLISLGSY